MTIKRLTRGSMTRAAQGASRCLSSALIISLPLILTLSTGCGDVDSASYQEMEASASMLLDLLGDEAPENLLFSYKLTFARVEVDAMGEDERQRAARGELLEMGESEYISITHLNTAQEESAISFEHGFAYVISLVATESSVKLSSAPSAPLMLYCPSADKDDNDEVQGGGCIQLVDQMEGR